MVSKHSSHVSKHATFTSGLALRNNMSRRQDLMLTVILFRSPLLNLNLNSQNIEIEFKRNFCEAFE